MELAFDECVETFELLFLVGSIIWDSLFDLTVLVKFFFFFS